ncbi:MAG: tetraacyldisaccharide 4'-kinase [Candidatus Omnitrophica bacterium]|nr:tetraacyldisaccharide 4'-kinase [Candidatus Omnitrophota bacterium]
MKRRPGIKNRIYQYWHSLVTSGKSEALFILLFFSFLYGKLTRFIREKSRGRRKKLNSKVISVGNITLGGTGKTPLVEYIARYLKEEGRKVGILSRGYGRVARHRICVSGGEDINFRIAGDEPVMLVKRNPAIPVFVGKDRYSAGRDAERKMGIDTFILDDGFQHWRLARDLDIVVLDGLLPFGNGYLIPRGNLRVPPDFLKYADAVVITRPVKNEEWVVRIKETICEIKPELLVAETVYQPQALRRLGSNETVSLSYLEGKRVGVLCGIGNPSSFRSTVEWLKAKVVKEFFFIDHYPFKERDIIGCVNSCRQDGIECIVTTEKDEVRLPQMEKNDFEIFVLEVSLKFVNGEAEFKEKIKRALA